MDAVTLSAALAAAKKNYVPIRGPILPNPLRGVPITDNVFSTGGNAAQSAVTGTARKQHTVAIAATDLRAVFVGSYVNSSTFADTDGTDGLVLKAALEISGVVYPLTFNGSRSLTLDGAGIAVSDPLPVDVAAGATISSRTFVSSGTWHSNGYSSNFSGGGGWVATTDLTGTGAGAVADSNSNLITPNVIVGTPLGSTVAPSVVTVGDSIAHGQGDATASGGFIGRNTNTRISGGGFLARALWGKAGYIQLAIQGDSANVFLANSGHFRRAALIAGASTMVCQYGRNDLSQGRTLAQIQASLLGIWKLAANRRLKRVIQTTITPAPTTTDYYQTPGNQTPQTTFDATRGALNDWIRAGAPIDPATLAAVAVGTAGSLVAGQTGHPLFGYWDVADAVESSRNSGKWKAPVNTRTVTDGAMTSGSQTITSATANFTAADVGRTFILPGAWSAGGTLRGLISSVTNSTTATANAAAQGTVSGGPLTIADILTQDGTHPTIDGHIVASSAVDTTMLA